MKRIIYLTLFLCFAFIKLNAQDFMMQAWYWNYPKTPSGANWVNTLNSQAAGLNGKFTYMWLPPLAKPNSGNNSNGYDPKDLYDYGQYNAGCPWGNRAGLNSLISSYNANNIKAVGDLVFNHRDGGKMENNPAVENWVKNFNGSASPYPSDRMRCILPLGTGTLNGPGDYYFKFSSATGNTSSYGNKPYRVYMETNKTKTTGLPDQTETEPNGGGDCGQANNTLTLGRGMICSTDASGCLTDEFKLTITAAQINAADTLYISFGNTNGDYSDHRPYGLWSDTRQVDIINEVKYQTATNFFGLPSGQGGMNYLQFKPNGTTPTSLSGDWDWMWFYYDYEQNNPGCMSVLKDWSKWNYSNVGIKGFRMDAIKHFPPAAVSEILNDMSANNMNLGMVVGESFDYNPYVLKGWVDQVTSGMTATAQSNMKVRVFDFALRNALKSACDGFGYDVRNVYTSGIVEGAGGNGFNAVTFLNNHDFRGPGEPIQNDPKLAYAYILTNNKIGVPCVYYPDYYGISYANAPTVNLQSEIDQLISIHKQHIFGSNQLEYLNKEGSFYLNGSNYISAGSGASPATTMIYQIKNGVSGRDVIVAINYSGATLKVDHLINTTGNPQNTVFTDLMGNSAFPTAQVDASGRIYIELPPRSYSVWLRQTGQPAAPVTVASTSVTNPTCAGATNGTATVSASGGGTGCNYSYLWSNGQSGATATNLGAGTYSVVAYCGNQNGAYTVTITTPPAITISAPTVTNITCLTTGSATALATGGTGAFTYTWSNNQTGATVPIAAAGTYTVTAIDANSCKKTATATVTANITPPTATIQNSGTITCVNSSVPLSTTTNANYQYNWLKPNGTSATTAAITATQAGTYNLTVTNTVNGCKTTANTVVVANTTPPIAQIQANGSITCTKSSVLLSNGTALPTYQYNWQAPNGGTGSGANYTATQGGAYSLTVTNSQNGCVTTATPTTISENKIPPTVTIANNNTQITCANPSVTLDASASTGSGALNYFWSGPGIVTGANTSSAIANLAGTYTVNVTDSNNGCFASKTVTITSNTIPTQVTTTSSAPSVSCAAPSVTVSATSATAVSYSWSGPNNFSANGQSTLVSNPGTYTVTATESNGCKGISTVTIQDNKTAPNFTVQGNTGICNNNPSTLSTSAAFSTYLWSNGAQTPTISSNVAGTYSVTVTGSNGCTGVASKTLSAAPQPSVSIPTDTLDCNKKSTVLNITTTSALASTVWTGPGNFSSNVLSPTFYTPGIYTLTATTSAGCSQNFTATLYQGQNALPVVISGVSALCAGATATTLTATPNLGTYLWSTGETSNSISIDTPGSYTVTVTNPQGCQGLANTNVGVGQNPIVTANDINVCQGQTAVLSANVSNVNNVTYSWKNDDTFNQNGQQVNIPNVAPNNVGFYYVEAKTSEGCVGYDTLLLNVSPTMNIVLNAKVDCNNNAVVSSNINGGVPTYQYKWNVSTATGKNITTTAPNNAIVTVTDNFGCVAISTPLNIIANTPIALSAVVKPATTKNDGAIDLSVTGTSGNVIYLWSNGATTQDISNIAPGKYCVSVTDANGCVKTECYDVQKSTVGTQETLISQSIAVYPNPTDEILNIDVKGNLTLTKIQLFDDKGRLIAQYNGNIRQIDMSTLPNAVYILQCFTQDDFAIKRVMKMK